MNRRSGPLSPSKSKGSSTQQSSLLSFYSPVKRNASEISTYGEVEDMEDSAYFSSPSSSSSSFPTPPTTSPTSTNIVLCKPTDIKRRKIGGSLHPRGNTIVSPLPSATPKKISPPSSQSSPNQVSIPVVKRAAPSTSPSSSPQNAVSPSISPSSSPSNFGDVSHLTPEQIERMERNRAIALERRAAHLKHSPPSSQSTPPSSSPSSSTSSQSRSTALASQFSSQTRLQSIPTSNSVSSTTLLPTSTPGSPQRVKPAPAEFSSALSRFAPSSPPLPLPSESSSTSSTRKSFIPSSPVSSSLKAATSRETDDKRWKWLVDIKDELGRRPDAPDYDPTTLAIPSLDFSALTDTRRQYWGYKRKHFDHVVFIQIGGFYELYETDADLGERLFNLHVTQRVNMRSCGVPLDAVEPWSSKLVAHGYKVAVMEQAGVGGGEKGAAQARRIRVVMTPGTLVDSILLTDPSSTYLLSIKENLDPLNPSYGICLVDCAIAEFNLGEFQDDSYRSSFETLLVQTRPKEIVFERGGSGLSERTRKLIKELIPNAIQNSRSPQEFWDSESTMAYLTTRFGDDLREWPELLQSLASKYTNTKGTGKSRGEGSSLDGSLALSALGACLHYLDELQLQELIRQRNFKDYKVLQRQNEHSSMILDGQTILNLEILGIGNNYPNSSASASSSSSLLSLMDHTVTPFGKRLFKRWLCHPLRQIPQINARLDAVEEIVADDTLTKTIKTELQQLPDLERLLSRINAGSIRLVDFLKVLDGFEHIWLFVTETMARFKLKSKLLLGLCTLTTAGGIFPEIHSMLSFFEKAIDKEASRKENKIVPKSGADEEYDAAEEDLNNSYERINSRLKDFRKMLRLQENDLKLIENSKKGNMLEVKKSALSENMKRLLPSSWNLVEETKTVTRYQDLQLKTLMKQLEESKENHKLALSGLYVRTLQKFQQFFEVCHSAVERIAHLDCLLSLAVTSKFTSAGMCRPVFSESSSRAFLNFQELRHPFLSSSVVRDFIPNDVKLGTSGEEQKGKEEESPYIMLLTGPNMGGKSTLLRQTCIAVIMAQVGCRVPALSAELSPIDRIFTRIGANDDIMAGRSTFFVELQETSNILRNATSHSLVILDELGRGTSTFDGYSIAFATLDYLAGGTERERKEMRREEATTPCVMFSTHYHMLVDDFENDSRVGNFHMGFFLDDDNKKVVFKYELEKGACKSSHGMNVARLAGMPEEIITKAEAQANAFEESTSRLRRRYQLAKDFSVLLKTVAELEKRDPKALERLQNLKLTSC